MMALLRRLARSCLVSPAALPARSCHHAEPRVRIKPEEVRRFIVDCMRAVRTPKEQAVVLANVLVAADHRGHFSHGLNRLEMYINDIRSGITVVDKTPAVVRETVSVAHVDGNNLLGMVVGEFSMNLAIRKAKETGVGWVTAKGSNHYGIAGWYSMMAASEGLLGISMTSTSPLMFPSRSQKVYLGTNPLSVAAPGRTPEDDFVLDMATTAVAVGKIEMKRRKNEPLPLGWAADKGGKVTESADEVLEGGGLLPLGGVELTGGYKGYGLSMLVELMCGIVGDATYGGHIRRWMNTTQVANLGQCFAAIDPEAIAPGFRDRLSAFDRDLRGLPPAEERPVLIPGDPERAHIAMCAETGGIPYHPILISSMNDLAAKMEVAPMKTVS